MLKVKSFLLLFVVIACFYSEAKGQLYPILAPLNPTFWIDSEIPDYAKRDTVLKLIRKDLLSLESKHREKVNEYYKSGEYPAAFQAVQDGIEKVGYSFPVKSVNRLKVLHIYYASGNELQGDIFLRRVLKSFLSGQLQKTFAVDPYNEVLRMVEFARQYKRNEVIAFAQGPMLDSLTKAETPFFTLKGDMILKKKSNEGDGSLNFKSNRPMNEKDQIRIYRADTLWKKGKVEIERNYEIDFPCCEIYRIEYGGGNFHKEELILDLTGIPLQEEVYQSGHTFTFDPALKMYFKEGYSRSPGQQSVLTIQYKEGKFRKVSEGN